MFWEWKSFSVEFVKVNKPLKVFNLHFAATQVIILRLLKKKVLC